MSSSLTIATIASIIAIIVIFCLYQLGKIPNTNESLLKMFLLIIFVFGTTWFIADTVLSWRNDKDNDDSSVNKFLGDEKNSELEKNLIENKMDKNVIKEKTYPEPIQKGSNRTNLQPDELNLASSRQDIKVTPMMKTKSNFVSSNKAEINDILKEPLTHVPEYRYIAKNKIQIPDELVDVYLDRGAL